MYLSTMRTYIKRLRAAIEDSKLEDAKAALAPALKAIGKAAQKGVIHKNTAARYSSRLSLAVNRLAKSGS